jgi:hypothetical protein
MKCRDFELIIAVVAHKRFGDTALDQVLAHAEGCDRCRTRLAHERALSYGVGAVIADMANDVPSLRVEAALLGAFNAHFAQRSSSPFVPTFARKRPRLHFRLAFAFAILLILISIPSIFWLRWRSVDRESEAFTQHDPSAGPSAWPPPVVPARGDEARVRRSAGTSRRQKRARPAVVNHQNVTELNAAEEVTEFFPLADGEDLTSLEAAQVARVELPVSALMELGLRVGPEISSGQIKADILVGLDGSARAIRFVR